MNVTAKTGELVTIVHVTDDDELMIINKSGITIRMAVNTLRVMGRATQGVKLIRINDGDSISSVAKIEYIEIEEDETLVDVSANEDTDQEKPIENDSEEKGTDESEEDDSNENSN